MSRIIKTQNGARARDKVLKLIGSAIYEFGIAKNDAERIDIASFIVLSLDDVESSVRATSAAWEKRDYWVKADQFQSEWSWVGQAKEKLVEAIWQKDDHKIGEVFEELRKNKKSLRGNDKIEKGN